MRAWVLAAALAAVASAPALAKPYTVDKSASKLGFTGAMNGAAFTGAFRRWDAVIDFDRTTCRLACDRDGGHELGATGTNPATRPSLADWFSAQGPSPRDLHHPRHHPHGPDRYSAAGDLTHPRRPPRWCCPSL
jgi:hypothetical protein